MPSEKYAVLCVKISRYEIKESGFNAVSSPLGFGASIYSLVYHKGISVFIVASLLKNQVYHKGIFEIMVTAAS